VLLISQSSILNPKSTLPLWTLVSGIWNQVPGTWIHTGDRKLKTAFSSPVHDPAAPFRDPDMEKGSAAAAINDPAPAFKKTHSPAFRPAAPFPGIRLPFGNSTPLPFPDPSVKHGDSPKPNPLQGTFHGKRNHRQSGS